MKQLALDWGELTIAFDNSFMETSCYLDTETGQILTVTDDARRQLERIYEEYFDPDDPDTFDIERALTQAGWPDWQKEDVKTADFVEQHFGSRVVAIPDTLTYEAYNEMQDFIATIDDDRLCNQLSYAIQGRGAFGRFRDVLRQHLAEEQRWYAFQDNRLRERILEWLHEMGIEPMDAPQATEVKIEDLVESRHKLLEEVLIFVQGACRISGVTRIALIGSLTTNKVDPKDADILISVSDKANLTHLATLGRKLQGHTQSFNRGGEVFLADEQHHYLGRICPWKRCEPGIRVSCDAQHCGKRPFLHDDLNAIKLSKSLIATPPLELWPQIITHIIVPEDVAELVIRPLQSD